MCWPETAYTTSWAAAALWHQRLSSGRGKKTDKCKPGQRRGSELNRECQRIIRSQRGKWGHREWQTWALIVSLINHHMIQSPGARLILPDIQELMDRLMQAWQRAQPAPPVLNSFGHGISWWVQVQPMCSGSANEQKMCKYFTTQWQVYFYQIYQTSSILIWNIQYWWNIWFLLCPPEKCGCAQNTHNWIMWFEDSRTPSAFFKLWADRQLYLLRSPGLHRGY